MRRVRLPEIDFFGLVPMVNKFGNQKNIFA
jgi:hypothetical protein